MMDCPWCDFEASPRQLHAHLAEQHEEMVTVEDRGTSRVYSIACPVCDAVHEQPIKPRLRDAGFLEEFADEIRLVAFDMLINHLLAEHGDHPFEAETQVSLSKTQSPGDAGDSST